MVGEGLVQMRKNVEIRDLQEFPRPANGHLLSQGEGKDLIDGESNAAEAVF